MKRTAIPVFLLALALPALAADEGLGNTVEPIVGARCRLFEVAADAYREEASDGIFPLKAAYGNRTPGILPEEVLKRCFDGTLERLPGIKLLWEDSFAATRGEAARFSVGPLPSATGRPLRLDLAASASFDDRANAAFFDVDFSLRPDGAGDDAPAVVLGSGKSQRVWWGGGYAVVARPVPRAEDSVPPYYLAVIGNWEHDGYRSVPVRPVGREVLDARYAEAAERGRDVLAEALCADFDAPVHRIYRLDAPSRTNLVAWFRGPDAPRPVPADPDLCTEALRALFVAAGGALSTNAVPGGDGDLFSDRTAEFLRYVPQTDSWIVLAPADRQDYFRKCLEGTIADDGLGPILLPSPSGSSENKRIDPPVIRPVFHSRLDPPADVASAALAARFGHPATNAPAATPAAAFDTTLFAAFATNVPCWPPPESPSFDEVLHALPDFASFRTGRGWGVPTEPLPPELEAAVRESLRRAVRTDTPPEALQFGTERETWPEDGWCVDAHWHTAAFEARFPGRGFCPFGHGSGGSYSERFLAYRSPDSAEDALFALFPGTYRAPGLAALLDRAHPPSGAAEETHAESAESESHAESAETAEP